MAAAGTAQVPEMGQQLSKQRFQNPLKIKLCVGSAVASRELGASGGTIGADAPMSYEQAVGKCVEP